MCQTLCQTHKHVLKMRKAAFTFAEAAKRLHILTYCMVKPQSNILVFSYASLSCFTTVVGGSADGRCPQGEGLRTVVTGVGTGVVAAPVPGFGVGPGVCGPDVCMHITQHSTFLYSNISKILRSPGWIPSMLLLQARRCAKTSGAI